MSKIIVITVREKNKTTGKLETIVSHGVDTVTMQNICLPNETPAALGAKYDPEYGEYVLEGNQK